MFSMGNAVRRTLIVAAVASTAGVAVASEAQALPQPGQVCSVLDPTPVWKYANKTGYLYTIPTGGGFRVTAGYSSGMVPGHGNGLADGFVDIIHIYPAPCS